MSRNKKIENLAVNESNVNMLKRYNSVTAIYRNRVPDFDDRLMLNAAGLWNFYLDAS